MDIGRLWAESKKRGEPGRAMPQGRSPDDLCPACERNGRVYCPHKPVLALRAEMARTLDKQDFFGPSPPNLFVGQFGYPSVSWGPMVTLAEGVPDNPKDWYGWGFDQIVRARSVQVRGRVNNSVLEAAGASPGRGREAPAPRILDMAQEAAMSSAPLDMEMRFSKKPSLAVEFHAVHQPMGPSAPLERMSLADNPKIPKSVDELVEEQVAAGQAMRELMGRGIDEHYLTRLLTAGVLGKRPRRRLVPTRWGITAVDDTMAKAHMERIRQFPQGNDFLLFFNEYLGNRFHVLLMPGAWEYEGFETWCGPMKCPNATPVELDGAGAREGAGAGVSGHGGRGSGGSPSAQEAHALIAPARRGVRSFAISEEYEPFGGRSDYAAKQGGGYYAARLGVAEALAGAAHRQYRALVIREIMPEYDLPVGVWEIRENVRHAMANGPRRFSSRDEMLGVLGQELNVPLSEYRARSVLLAQRRLADY